MSVKCKHIVELMNVYAPIELAESWDNVGLMVGDMQRDVNKVMVALDINDEVINEAIVNSVDMIVTHHPMIFKPISNVTSETPLGRRLIKLIQEGIAVYSAHTNLDVVSGGTNSTLAELLGLISIENLVESENPDGMGKVGVLEKPMTFLELINNVKTILGAQNLVVSGDVDKIISKVGICTGSGANGEFMKLASAKGCQAYITGDVGYHNAQMANDLGLCIIDGSHYLTEVLIVPVLCDYLSRNLTIDCVCSAVDGQTLHII